MIQRAKDLVKQAKIHLNKLQKGEINLVRTGKPELDSTLGGLLPGDVVLIAALSGGGKTYYLEELKRNIMTPEFNPTCSNYVMLNYNLEMKVFNLAVRGIKEVTGLDKKTILKEPFKEDTLPKVREFFDSYGDDRFFIEEEAPTPDIFFRDVNQFVKDNQDKEAIFITIDHIGLLAGTEKTKVIAETVEFINKIKLTYNNVYFLVLSQLNRDILKRTEEKSNTAFPRSSDIFQSSTINQIASFSVIVHQPYRLNITEYGKINPEFYSYLSEHFVDISQQNKKISLKTENRVFTHIVKSREDSIGFRNLYINKVGDDFSQEPKSSSQLVGEIEPPDFKQSLQLNTSWEEEDDLFLNQEDSPF